MLQFWCFWLHGYPDKSCSEVRSYSLWLLLCREGKNLQAPPEIVPRTWKQIFPCPKRGGDSFTQGKRREQEGKRHQGSTSQYFCLLIYRAAVLTAQILPLWNFPGWEWGSGTPGVPPHVTMKSMVLLWATHAVFFSSVFLSFTQCSGTVFQYLRAFQPIKYIYIYNFQDERGISAFRGELACNCFYLTALPTLQSMNL